MRNERKRFDETNVAHLSFAEELAELGSRWFNREWNTELTNAIPLGTGPSSALATARARRGIDRAPFTLGGNGHEGVWGDEPGREVEHASQPVRIDQGRRTVQAAGRLPDTGGRVLQGLHQDCQMRRGVLPCRWSLGSAGLVFGGAEPMPEGGCRVDVACAPGPLRGVGPLPRPCL